MSDKQKIIRIFIGSPGGLKEERQAAHDVVNSVNRSHADRWGVQFRLLGWEDSVPGYARAQDKINEDLDKCDYFIGVLWDHWGTPPGSKYTSGFEEEYSRAEQRVKNGLMKDMAIYFKKVEVPDNMEPGKELRKVKVFRQKLIDDKKVFFKDFADLPAFKDVVREKLEEIGWKETELRVSEEPQSTQSNNAASIQDKSVEPPVTNERLLDKQARDFLEALIQRSKDWDGTSPQEVARLRLIGTAVVRGGNDQDYLGNHDANLIFRHFRDTPLSKQEFRALIDCGVAGFQHQNVPLWRWLSKYGDDGIWTRLIELAVYGEDTLKRYAIDILGLGSLPIPSLDEYFTKERVLLIWLSDETPDQVFNAAVSFLGSNADRNDLKAIEERAASVSAHRRAKIEQAIVSIMAKTNPNGALKLAAEKEADITDKELLDSLFGNPRSLDTATVTSCLATKSELVRSRAVKLLVERNAITLAAAQTLLTDSNHEIRLLAAERLKKLGVELNDDTAKKALSIVKPNSNPFGAIFLRNETDETYYDRYRANRLLEMDFQTLQSKAEGQGVIGYRELSALYVKYPKKMREFVRTNLADGFKGYLESIIENGKVAGEISTTIETQIRSLEQFLRKRMCNDALTALCAWMDARDLGLVREVLGTVEIDANEGILKYLARFGDWSDIELVKKLGDYPTGRTRGLLSFFETKAPEQKAKAIIAICKERVADMLDLELDGTVRISIAKQLRKTVFVGLADEILIRELGRNDDKYRIVFSLRCVLALSRSRLTKVLDWYVDSSDHRFYNSIHWLDLGASLPTNLARSVAERALSTH